MRFEGWHDYFKEIDTKVQLNLSGRAGEDVIAAIGLLDLYGPGFYPGGVSHADERHRWAKKQIEDKVGSSRFRQHFAVHEVEAWLLADLAILPAPVRASLAGTCDWPETVDFGEPPSRLLNRLFRAGLGRQYKKVTDGAELFRQLAPDKALDKCPHLKALLDEMLTLAKEAMP